MLSHSLRFHGRRSVMRTLSGKSIRTKNLQVKFLPSFRNSYRVGVTVSKKVHKSAVKRNRVRRRIYETIRREGLLEGKKVDVLILVYDETLVSWSQDKLTKELCYLTETIKKTIK